MKVIIAGGWAYGNLGDDAILEATAKLVARHLSGADVHWLTYDVDATRASGVELAGVLHPSVHRYLDHGRSFWMMQTVGKCTAFARWPRAIQRVYLKYFRKGQEDRAAKRDVVESCEELFRDADLFIMSGGGYFNVWPTMFEACVREMEWAHRAGCKVLLIGQSVGPFTAEQKEILRKTLKVTDVCFVRDGESVAELAGLGVQAELMPDLALGFPVEAMIEKGLLTVIPGELDKRREKVIADELVKLCRGQGGRIRRLQLLTTCSIWSDVMAVRHVAARLAKDGVEAEVVEPLNYRELVKKVEGSEWVVSRRMHGMVIGWRAGSRVFSFTRSRKIVGLLDLIGCAANICAEDDWAHLAEKVERAMEAAREEGKDLRGEIAQQVDVSFEHALERVGINKESK